MLRVMRKELRGLRGAVIGWGVGTALWAFWVIFLFPSMATQMAEFELPDFYKAFGDWGNIGTLEGWLSAEVFSILVPIVLGLFAIIAGSGALAGEEDAGTMEMMLAMPLARWQIVVAKAAALTIAIVLVFGILAASMWGGLQMIADQVTLTVTVADGLRATVAGVPVIFFFTMFALWLGSYLPTRRHALSLAGAVLMVSYLVNNLSALLDSLKPLQPYSPLYYYPSGKALTEPLNGEYMALMIVLGLVFLGLAVLSFERRNVTVGAWPWQRPCVPST